MTAFSPQSAPPSRYNRSAQKPVLHRWQVARPSLNIASERRRSVTAWHSYPGDSASVTASQSNRRRFAAALRRRRAIRVVATITAPSILFFLWFFHFARCSSPRRLTRHSVYDQMKYHETRSSPGHSFHQYYNRHTPYFHRPPQSAHENIFRFERRYAILAKRFIRCERSARCALLPPEASFFPEICSAQRPGQKRLSRPLLPDDAAAFFAIRLFFVLSTPLAAVQNAQRARCDKPAAIRRYMVCEAVQVAWQSVMRRETRRRTAAMRGKECAPKRRGARVACARVRAVQYVRTTSTAPEEYDYYFPQHTRTKKPPARTRVIARRRRLVILPCRRDAPSLPMLHSLNAVTRYVFSTPLRHALPMPATLFVISRHTRERFCLSSPPPPSLMSALCYYGAIILFIHLIRRSFISPRMAARHGDRCVHPLRRLPNSEAPLKNRTQKVKAGEWRRR